MVGRPKAKADKIPDLDEVTDEMIEAGTAVLWSAPKPPNFVREQVATVYRVMEAVRRAVARPR